MKISIIYIRANECRNPRKPRRRSYSRSRSYEKKLKCFNLELVAIAQDLMKEKIEKNI